MRRIVTALLPFLAATLCLFSCGQKGDLHEVRNGDLIFVGLPVNYGSGSDSMSEAIGAATIGDNELNIIHVAILEVQDDSLWVIDATIKHGWTGIHWILFFVILLLGTDLCLNWM